ncbi:MAG: mandelate racemase/muconate lactonizing enzyme family protein [Oscillospiraceae bacterium]|nr:mandelate racemase/muconate lactonizing enzyme family protein [Oscillospiraceae bacterium]
MLIDRIETFATKDICHVRVTDSDGAQGWGMTAPFNADISAQVLHRIAASVAFRRYEDFREVADDIIHYQYKFLGTFVVRAAAGIDTALWDLNAKRAGVPVKRLIGSRRDKIDLYATSMGHIQPVEGEAARLRAIQDTYGLRAIKLHAGTPAGKDREPWPGCIRDMVLGMRKAAVEGTHLFVDINGNFSVGKAIETARFLKDNGIEFFEEPCPYWETDQTKAVRDACELIGLPVAGGEQDYIEPIWKRMIDTRVVDICQPDLLYVGGFTRALRVAARAASRGMMTTPHTSNQSPIAVMGLHYMSVIENPYPFMECGMGEAGWAKDCYHPHIDIVGGAASAPDVPGWGYDPDEDFLARSEKQESTRQQ